MRKIIYFLGGIALFFIVQQMFTGYGNVSSHRNINSLIVEQFNQKLISTAFPSVRFKNHLFVLNGNNQLPGSFISEGGWFDIKEEQMSITPAEWIVHGGYSADEPEIKASFRHFYDPTESKGNRYLHDHLDKLGSVNPRIDHLDWALDHSDHQYNWKNGKAAMMSALQSDDKDFRKEEMAFAWRALGETLHMIADMGCPAHVRDDAHAAETSTGYRLGSPDPYEENVEALSKVLGIKEYFPNGKLDTDLQSKFRNAQTVNEIAIELAKYTNENFFTTQTISGSSVVPLIHPEKTYASPRLDDCTYDEVDFVYKKNISGNEVLMCSDLKYSYGIFKGRGYPYINVACTRSQATALIPQIVEAGVHTMRLFIPEMKIEITEYDEEKETLKGKVIHTTNSEYTREIKYNGRVDIIDAKSRMGIVSIDCEDGKFEKEVKKRYFRKVDWKDYGIYAEFEFGGIVVRSEPFKEEIKNEEDFSIYKCVSVDYFAYDKLVNQFGEVSEYGELSLFPLEIGGRIGNLNWNGTSFSGDSVIFNGPGSNVYWPDRTKTWHIVVSGEISNDYKTLLNVSYSISYREEDIDVDYLVTMNSSITIENVPRFYIDDPYFAIKGKDAGNHVTLEYNHDDHYFYHSTDWKDDCNVEVWFSEVCSQ